MIEKKRIRMFSCEFGSARDAETFRPAPSRLFPQSLPPIEGLDYYGECRPARRLDGDFFDFISLPENGLAVAVGDLDSDGVALPGVKSGLQALLRRHAVRGFGDVTQVVEELNRAVCRITPDPFCATLFYASVDPLARSVRYVSARHEPALLVRTRTGFVERLDCTGTVLGLSARATYDQRTLSLDPRDVLIAFTDGISKAADGEGHELGEAGILRAFRDCTSPKASDVVTRILDETDRFTNDTGPCDDRTAVVLRFSDLAAKQPRSEEEAIELAATAA